MFRFKVEVKRGVFHSESVHLDKLAYYIEYECRLVITLLVRHHRSVIIPIISDLL